MGSYPNERVDATPDPRFGGYSSTVTNGPDSEVSGAEAQDGAQHVPLAPGARPWRARGHRPGGPGAPPSQEVLEADRRNILQALILTIGILVLVWGVFLIDLQFDLGLRRHGNRPLQSTGLKGILTMPFLHGGWEHLWGNTVSFFTLSGILLYFYRGIGPRVLFWSWIGSGTLLWSSGASGNHIGLSGVIYALAAFLFMSGVIRRHAVLMRVALVVVFLYGGIVWGVFPIEIGVSWQGHLAGACTGGLLALVLRREGPQPPPSPHLEDDEEDEGDAEFGGDGENGNRTPPPGSFIESGPPSWEARRQQLLWKGARPRTQRPVPPAHRGIRKSRMDRPDPMD